MSVNITIKQLRKTAAQWTSDNTVLGAGVLGYETDTGKYKLGDGVTAWNSLAYPQFSTDTSGLVPYTGATTNVDLGEFGVNSGYLQFDLTPTNTPTTQGTAYWDDSAETVALIMNGTTQKVGEDTFYHVKNSTGSLIAKGTAVMFAGTDGASGKILITPFLADGTYPSSYFMGITAEAIANGANGKVYHFGKMRGIDTSVYQDGDILYASTTSAGGFQTAKPSAPNNVISVAAVVNAGNNGTLMIRPIIEDSPTLDDVTTAGNTTTNSISVGGLAVDTNTLFVDAVNNRVGIGTSTPASNLEVNRSASGTSNSIFYAAVNNTTYSANMGISVTQNFASTRLNFVNGVFGGYIGASTSQMLLNTNNTFSINISGGRGTEITHQLAPTTIGSVLKVKCVTTDAIGQIIQAAAGQTANLLDILNSSSQKLLSVEANQNSRFRVYNSDGSQNTMISFNVLNMYTSRFIVTAGLSDTNIFPNSGVMNFLIASSDTRATYFRYTNDSPRRLGASSGSQDMILIDPNVNQSSTAGYSMIRVNPTHTGTGSGSKFLTWLGVGGTARFSVESDGTIRTNGNAGFTGTGSYTNFTIENGIITAAS